MSAETEELLELIAHKLKFVEDRPLVMGLASVRPLGVIHADYWLAKLKAIGAQAAPQHVEMLSKEIEVLLLKLEGFSLAESLAQLPELMAIEGWDQTRALQNQKVYILDDRLFESASALEQTEMLAEMIYPKFFTFGHEGKAWVKFSF